MHALALVLALVPTQNAPALPALLARVDEPTGEPGTSFGLELAAADDWLAVGSRSSLAGPAHGAVFVHRRDAGGPDAWGLVQTVIPPVPGSTGVRMTGATLAFTNSTGPCFCLTGAVFVYGLSNRRWTLEDVLTDPVRSDFAHSLAAGRGELFVGAGLWECYTGSGQPEALLRYELEDAGWSATAFPQSAAMVSGQNYGRSLALDGDTLVVAEPGGFAFCGNAGLPLRVFRRDVGGANAWGLVTTIQDPTSGTGIGARLDLSGDLLAAGADDAILVFDRNAGGPGNWGLVLDLPQTAFGKAGLAIGGERLYEGARSPANEGIVRVYERDLGGENAWGLVGTLTADDPAPGDQFGRTIVAEEDRVYVGADDAVYVFGTPGRGHGAAFGSRTAPR